MSLRKEKNNIINIYMESQPVIERSWDGTGSGHEIRISCTQSSGRRKKREH